MSRISFEEVLRCYPLSLAHLSSLEILRIFTEGLRTTLNHRLRVCRPPADAWGSSPHAVPVDKETPLMTAVRYSTRAKPSAMRPRLFPSSIAARMPHGRTEEPPRKLPHNAARSFGPLELMIASSSNNMMGHSITELLSKVTVLALVRHNHSPGKMDPRIMWEPPTISRQDLDQIID